MDELKRSLAYRCLVALDGCDVSEAVPGNVRFADKSLFVVERSATVVRLSAILGDEAKTTTVRVAS